MEASGAVAFFANFAFLQLILTKSVVYNGVVWTLGIEVIFILPHQFFADYLSL